MYRDPIKLLTTKQFYMKKNANIINNPALHPLALAAGLRAEKMSHLCEDILIARALQFGALEKGFISVTG